MSSRHQVVSEGSGSQLHEHLDSTPLLDLPMDTRHTYTAHIRTLSNDADSKYIIALVCFYTHFWPPQPDVATPTAMYVSLPSF